ncbi:hypothetical protein GALMADRAFT_251278 [Galerina marginata CBS 339.88]|uniref:Uncharacterized protein n=1 Tax=Galerina marginata (strain CBS 339.88) TaxID=685588 RepID=A0A067T3G1_GALM3|nr:hypothetical protein GALMADRAFT_251278 [Galerina marginata CBS 339.88]
MDPGGFRLPGTPASKSKQRDGPKRKPKPPAASVIGKGQPSSDTHIPDITPEVVSSPKSRTAASVLRFATTCKPKPKPKPKPVPEANNQYTGGKRNLAHGLDVDYHDMSKLAAELEALKRTHLRPIVESTALKYHRAKLLWLQYFRWVYKEGENPDELAEATLAAGAAFPPIERVKHFVGYCAKTGRSGFKGRTGWSLVTTRNFFGSVLGMLNRHHTIPPLKADVHNVLNMIAHEAKIENTLPTVVREKRIVREVDLLEFQAAILHPRLRITSSYMRLQAGAFSNLLFITGMRPGTGLELSVYIGKQQYLKWMHVEWIVKGWEDGVGIVFETFWTFEYMKGMRLVESDKLETSISSLDKGRMLLDCLLQLVAMGIANDVFEDDVLHMMANKANLPAKLPYTLKIKDHALERPIFTQARNRAVGFTAPVIDPFFNIPPPSTSPSPSISSAERARNVRSRRVDKQRAKQDKDDEDILEELADFCAMSVKSMEAMMAKISKTLGWKNFSMRSFRYAFAAHMLGRVSDPHLKHLMGHRFNTNLIATTYQPPTRPVDHTAARFDTPWDLSLVHAHSSVAWGREDSELVVDQDTIMQSSEMQKYLDVMEKAEVAVREKFNCSSLEVPPEDFGDPLLTASLDAWADVMRQYQELACKRPTRSNSAMSMASDPGSVGSAMSTTSHRPPSRSSVGSAMSTASHRQSSVKAHISTAVPALVSEQPVISDIMQDILGTLDSMDFSHPFLLKINHDFENPRYWVTLQDLALVEAAKLRDKGICPHCYADDSLTKKEQNKVWTDHYSSHVWKCEGARHRPDCWRCPLCAALVPFRGDPECGAGESAIIVATLEDHRNACHASFLGKLQLLPEEEEEEEDEDEEEQGARSLEGPNRLSITHRVDRSRTHMRLLFCPICMFATSTVKSSKGGQMPGDDDCRFAVFENMRTLLVHLETHWKTRKVVIGGIKYDENFKCGFPECSAMKKMNTGKFITHLHTVHRYPLVDCSIEHTHDDQCYTLSAEFLTITDARLMHLYNLKPAVPTANLIDYRRAELQKTQRDRIVALARKEQGADFRELDRESVPSTPASEPASENLVEPDDTADHEMAVSVSENEGRLRDCMKDLEDNTKDIEPEEIALLTEFLVSQDVTVEQSATLSKDDLVEAGLHWKLGKQKTFRSFVEKWLTLYPLL